MMLSPQHPTPLTLFFAGTDTDVGKTFVACAVARALSRSGKRVGVYKPVASGCRDENGTRIADDATALWQAAGCSVLIDQVCPQKFLAPLAPPAAAEAEGTCVDAALLHRGADALHDQCDLLIVEGAGGLFSPLADGVLNIDLVKQFVGAKVVIVAANRLGAIHQTLATIEAARHRGVNPAGLILNDITGTSDSSIQTNASQIRQFTDVPILAELPYRHFDSDGESAGALSSFNFDDFFSTKFIDALFMQ
ncbi:dethiobiotin synthase [Rubripirellula reticaptiva]|uniref:ATP-dependent dethiobiotin synthetase BioD n=1 Tax=Rubripirellula reticaptiva TaxID=2528013 RepID=A0A5C6F4L5_9BACT|nr:dethiobiotin synthase [Rubripirellula reticaptiva]TWU55454.1 ATP-dependent dethiobiotin synthetase BioD 1 [Rubripirellula reticaptiva]